MSVTHVFWRDDEVSFVDPAGYSDSPDLVPIEAGWDGPFMKPDFGARTFVPDLAGARAARWVAVKTVREERRYGGCQTPLGRIDTDLESQHKINGAVTMAMLLGAAFSVEWTMADNSLASHDADQMKAAGLAVGAFDAACHAAAQGLREQIEAAGTVDAILAIDIEGAAWPPTGG